MPRSDAQKNRAAVLAAAARLFGERGTSVAMAEVARAAGVGPGTVYRHFSTKQQLFEAQAAGAVRGDIGVPELKALLGACFLACHGDDALRRPVMSIALDGLSTTSRPAPEEEEVRR